MHSSILTILSAAGLFQATYCLEYLIQSQLEFVQFVKNVNSGTDYQGDTVFLDKDLDFEGYARFNPIGYTREAIFNGVFIGQGHVISNYLVNTSAQYAGIFGFTQGATITNLMVDPSCKIVSTYKSYGTAYVGSVIAKCFSINQPCKFENMMNYGQVIFSGNASSGDIAIGGIAGSCEFSGFHCIFKSCVNSGRIIDMGAAGWFSQMGGITGVCDGREDKRCKLHNNLNHGELMHNGTAKDTIIGGIVGTMYGSTNVQNCMNAGKITEVTRGRYNHLGAIAGYAFEGECSLSRNYWVAEVGAQKPVGYNYTEALSITETGETKLDGDFIRLVNKRAHEHNWDTWILNNGGHNFAFIINMRLIFATTNKIIILADRAINEGYHSLGSFLDAELTVPFNNYEITADTVVYSRWARNPYTFTLVYSTPIGGICDGEAAEAYPEFCGNVTSGVQNVSMTIGFALNLTIPELPPVEGYMAMWCTKDRSLCDPPAMVSYDLVLYPTYILPVVTPTEGSSDSEFFNNSVSRYVRITFRLENMYTSEVEDIIRKYGGESVHEVIDMSAEGLTTVVMIRFEKVEDASEFVDSIRASTMQAHTDKISKVEYLDEKLFSFGGRNSPVHYFVFWMLLCFFEVFWF